MQKPSILIVGAGALGAVTGYHFSLAGADVTFFVRPSKRESLRPPLMLYCYDDGELKEFADYHLVSSAAEVAARRHDYVLVTFDGATCRGSEGTQLLRELADAIRPTAARMVICGVGIGLRQHFLDATGLPESRLMEGTLGCFSHQVANANLPLHPPTDPAKLARASIAYHHFGSKVGFVLAKRPAAAAKEFAALYNRCGVSRCSLVNVTINNIISNAFFPLTASCELAGWPNADGLAADKPLWSRCCQATREIVALPQHGWIGKLASLMLGDRMFIKLVRKLEQDSLPLDFHAFNRFHHGAKVLAQDIQVMHNCAQAGTAQGQPMTALKELLQALEAHLRTKNNAD